LAELAEPKIRVGYFSVDARQAVFHVLARPDPATGAPFPVDFDRVILDPWTGRELGHYRDADLYQGAVNVVPFVFRLHADLTPIPLGGYGGLILGIVAVAWSIDCFVGFYLTLPHALARFLRRWKPSWLVKWPAGAFRVNFDLHRAGGLWFWPLLFVLAWSSVMFTLAAEVYEPVMRTLFDYRSMFDDEGALPEPGSGSKEPPHLNWLEAQAVGERLVADIARERGFTVERPFGMAYIPEERVYTYDVVASVNVQGNGWNTGVWLDADTGALKNVFLPSGEHTGNTVETWLRALHFADLRNWLAFRILVFIAGIVIAVLSVTGVYIWLRKRRGRVLHGLAPSAPGGAARWPQPH
jgi:uncharacterized iron-regulated membrane protein